MQVEPISSSIKENCNISDAKYWGYFSICNLLLRLRDLYHQEHFLHPWDRSETGVVSQWIQTRESMWEGLEEESFRPVIIEGRSFDPFDTDGINEMLTPHGLLYGAGYGLLKKPNFFLSRIERSETHDDHTIWFVDLDYSRDLSPPIAFHQNGSIVIRKHIFAGYLYNKYLELGSRHSISLLRRAFASRGFHGPAEDPFAADKEELGLRVNALADELSVLLLWHELGEHGTTDDNFRDLIMASEDRLTEFRLRSIKDVLSDTHPRGPLSKIQERRDAGLLYFYGALQDDTSRSLFPEMGQAIADFEKNDGWESIESMRKTASHRAMTLYEDMLSLYADGGPYRETDPENEDDVDPAMQATLKSIRDYFKQAQA